MRVEQELALPCAPNLGKLVMLLALGVMLGIFSQNTEDGTEGLQSEKPELLQRALKARLYS